MLSLFDQALPRQRLSRSRCAMADRLPTAVSSPGLVAIAISTVSLSVLRRAFLTECAGIPHPVNPIRENGSSPSVDQIRAEVGYRLSARSGVPARRPGLTLAPAGPCRQVFAPDPAAAGRNGQCPNCFEA